MKYAIIKINGSQLKVAEGEEFLTDKVSKEEVEPQILMVVDDAKFALGKPFVKNSKINLKVLEDVKGDKITVIKYKSKSRYRRRMGFRPQFTRIKVEKIILK